MTDRRPVKDTYHGIEVVDDYRWLEDASSERTRAWTQAQNDRTRAYLKGLPAYDEIRRRMREVISSVTTSYADLKAGGASYFALKRQPPRQQPLLVTLKDLSDTAGERVVVDPNGLDESGLTTIDWFVPSPDGRLVAASLSSHGTEDGVLHLFEVATCRVVDVRIPRASLMGGGSIAWRGDSTGFWYTRHPSPGERPDQDLPFYQEIWFHELGATSDRPELSGVFADDRIVQNILSSSGDGRWVLDLAQRGDGDEWEVFVRRQDEGGWRMLAGIPDRVAGAVLGRDEIFLLSRKDSPNGTVLRLRLDPDGASAGRPAGASVVVPASPLAIEGLTVTDRTLWTLDIDGGVSGLRGFDLDGTPRPPVELPPVCAIDHLGRLDEGAVGYTVETFVSPPEWWIARDGEEGPRRTALRTSTTLDLSGLKVRRTFAASRDGTRVPISLIAAAGTLESGPAPTLLTGYGGYGISLKPRFRSNRMLWLERGFVLAVANVRGGGEYGDAWHQAGRLLTKQNCFDDFAACARHLVSAGVTSVDRLAILGGSNGGLLMGAVLTQHPDVARVVVAEVPVLDMLRTELHPNGAYNVAEFGSVEDPEQFVAMFAYSPYHHVVDGARYPAVLLTAGEFDPRVDAHHAKKMTARLQAATSSGEPILLRMESGGHGMGQSLDQEIALQADILAFVCARLGLG